MPTIDLSFIDTLPLSAEQKENTKNIIWTAYARCVATIQHANEKSNLEFSRYKQDCRKRALDLASEQIKSTPFEELFDKESFMKSGKVYHQSIARDEIFMKLADKYYNWLISIPE